MDTNLLEKIQLELSTTDNQTDNEKYCGYFQKMGNQALENVSDIYDFQGTSQINYDRYIENNHLKR